MVLHTTNGWTLMWTASTSSLYAVVFSLGVVWLMAGERVSRRQMVGAVVLYIVALLSREISIMVPFIVALIRWWRYDDQWRHRARRTARDTGLLFGVLCGFLALRLVVSGFARSRPDVSRLVPILDPGGFAKTWPMVPTHLRDILMLATSPFRSVLDIDGFAWSTTTLVVGVCVWGTLILLVIREARRGRFLPLVGMGWFLLGSSRRCSSSPRSPTATTQIWRFPEWCWR